MSTLQEIKAAILKLNASDRLCLLDWIHLQEEADDLREDPALLAGAKEGARQLDAGQGIPLDEARKLASGWTR